MSYNIDTFKLKHVRLILPIDVEFSKYSNWDGVARLDFSKGTWLVETDGGEGLKMNGKVTLKGIEVNKIECDGECSGYNYFQYP